QDKKGAARLPGPPVECAAVTTVSRPEPLEESSHGPGRPGCDVSTNINLPRSKRPGVSSASGPCRNPVTNRELFGHASRPRARFLRSKTVRPARRTRARAYRE